ncbi:universal stress protein A [Iodidimonas muriae]|uniref:Universal stress protein A n=1 Tax=Iodidimonas muriae TaxID=261467 RepID=A0ABQ2L9J9_9PROT|nr:universal stress protein [Iodidimonas muriae]GER05905.1 universal stress protein A [Kordiimonadales bacterium JCM 17843]GGO07341.1 universal stress protein A [Iodidimonas muriae]
MTTDIADHRSLGPISDHPRNFVVVVDESEEAQLAIRFASGRAGHIVGGGIILFHAVAPGDFQHWKAVADRMRDEGLSQAQAMLEDVAARIYAYSGVKPEIVVREGPPKEELHKFIKERQDLFALVLAASAGGEPGPLVDYFSGPMAANLPCPVVIVPGTLEPETIDRLV